MHEMGIVLNLAKKLEETARENDLVRIGSVTLSVGEVSGIMTDYFTDCWDYFKVRHEILKESELILETIPAVTYSGLPESGIPRTDLCPRIPGICAVRVRRN